MKINEISNSINKVGNLDPSQVRQREADNVSSQASEKEFEKGTKVDISQASVDFSKAAEKMENVPEERAARLDELKMMVKNNTYNVDSKKVAAKVLEDSITNII